MNISPVHPMQMTLNYNVFICTHITYAYLQPSGWITTAYHFFFAVVLPNSDHTPEKNQDKYDEKNKQFSHIYSVSPSTVFIKITDKKKRKYHHIIIRGVLRRIAIATYAN